MHQSREQRQDGRDGEALDQVDDVLQRQEVGRGQGQDHAQEQDHEEHQDRGRRDTLAPPERFRDPHETSGVRSRSADRSQLDGVHGSATPSMRSYDAAGTFNSQDEDGEQDIQEVWFPGCHAVSAFYLG